MYIQARMRNVRAIYASLDCVRSTVQYYTTFQRYILCIRTVFVAGPAQWTIRKA